MQKLHQADAAIASYDKAIVLQPDYAEAYYNRGLIQQSRNQLDAAIASYDKAIALKPGYADALFNRGIALLELKKLDAAVASFDKAIALKPDIALGRLGQAGPDVECYRQALHINPKLSDAHHTWLSPCKRVEMCRRRPRATAAHWHMLPIAPTPIPA